ncbi:MAG: phosphopantetheine-binding protein [Negativicutes bacterium]|nr:phosphopantetheine-binding protein [Negativicutes bacterium]
MVLERVIAVIAKKIECDPATISAETKFEELGIDSLEVIELLMSMEEEFATEIELGSTKLIKVADLVSLIEAKIQ